MATSIEDRFKQFTEGLSQKYEPFVRQHLAKVYGVLGITTLFTALGVLLQMKSLIDLGVVSALGSLGLVLGLHFYQDNGKNYNTRLAMLLGFGFCSGQSMGPLIGYVIQINPAILFTAFVGTFIIFVSLSLAALLAERGKYLFLGGLLVSVLNTMAVLSLFNMFFRSYFVQLGQLYIGVFVMAAFILFDTQSIIEKCRRGNVDVVQHSLDLFFDVLSLFRRILIILTQKNCASSKI
ncbi:bax inhibitor 1 isoform X3 [Teleopsis dalmanni]|uniref:bax inhibitor 1 isoform X3 n=1 Tax=Teleopsis dalmanni TaxID=139649 RepID=UPI0018CD70FD|nr:bax inhibitor 1 isoform X3 [Teleopsis dalmanni]